MGHKFRALYPNKATPELRALKPSRIGNRISASAHRICGLSVWAVAFLKPNFAMSTDDIFKASEKRQATATEEQRQRANRERVDREEQAEKARRNASTIDKRLRAALDYFTKQEYPTVKQHGYDIQHQFSLTRNQAIPAGQTYNRLTLYLGRSVVATFGDPPYRAPYMLNLLGDELTGTIGAHFHSNDVHYDQQLGSLLLETDLEPWLIEVFRAFVECAVSSDGRIDRNPH